MFILFQFFTYNFLSLRQLMEWGYNFHFEDDIYIIRNKNKEMSPITIPKVERRTFSIKISKILDFAMLVGNVDEFYIWHQNISIYILRYIKFLVKRI